MHKFLTRDDFEEMKIIGLLPFFIMVLYPTVGGLTYQRVFAFLVAMNGFICHRWYRSRFWMIDLCMNVIMVVLVNMWSCWQYTGILTLFVTVMYGVKYCGVTQIADCIIHVLVVEWVLSFILWMSFNCN